MSVTFLTDKDGEVLKKELEEKIEEASKSGNVTDEQIEDAVEDYFEENPLKPGGNVSDEQIEQAIRDYLEKNPIEGVVTVDTALSEASTNPVQNKVVTKKIKEVETTVGNIDVLLGTI